MPWTYDDFIKEYKGLTEEDRKTINDFIEFQDDARKRLDQMNDDLLKKIVISEDKTEKQNSYENLNSTFNNYLTPHFNDALDDLKNDRIGRTEWDFNNACEYISEFIRVMNKKNVLESYFKASDYRKYENVNDNEKLKEIKPVENYFKFAELMKKTFKLNVDIDAQRKSYDKYLEREDHAAASSLTAAFKNYRNGKLNFRGSKEYKDIGPAFNSAISQMKKTEDVLKSLEKEDNENLRKAAVAELENSIKKLAELKGATDNYYTRKKTDGKGQWSDYNLNAIKNTNARNRIAAARNIDDAADRITAIYQRKLYDLKMKDIKSEKLIEEDIIQAPDKINIDAPEDKIDLNTSINKINIDIIEKKDDMQISEKEDPLFTKAVKKDRELIQKNLFDVVKDDDLIFTEDNMNAAIQGIAGVIATNLISKKMDIKSPHFLATKNTHTNNIAEKLKTLTENGTLPVKDLEKFAEGAFTNHGTALVMEYGKLVKPVKKEDVTKSDKIITKSKKGFAI